MLMKSLHLVDSFCTLGTLFGPKNHEERGIYRLSQMLQVLENSLLMKRLGLVRW